MNTAFIFENLFAGGVENEFLSFDSTSLLFLRNVRRVEVRGRTQALTTLRREAIGASRHAIRLTINGNHSEWLVEEKNDVAIAFRRDGERIVRLDEREAVVHAFLPTMEPTGLGVKIHSDVSTDPSRTRIVFDDRTSAALAQIAVVIVSLLETGLSRSATPEAQRMVTALAPSSDPRMAGFQRRSFKTELYAAIKNSAQARFADLRLRPAWLNAVDFESLSVAGRLRVVPYNLENAEGLETLLRFLGAKEATFEDLSPSLNHCIVSIPGAAELVAQLSQRHAMRQIDASQVKAEWRLWPVSGKVLSLTEAKAKASSLDRDFTDLLVERSVGTEAFRLITAVSGEAVARSLFRDGSLAAKSHPSTDHASTPTGATIKDTDRIPKLSLKKWRSAEQQVLALLTASGWKVEDVSRQNVGYDISARTPDGEDIYLEVKSIDYVGQPFTLTSNEEAVARQKGGQYQLAIVRQDGADFLEIAFIRDPIHHLKLTRQCRQWVWECAEYTLNPRRFPLE